MDSKVMLSMSRLRKTLFVWSFLRSFLRNKKLEPRTAKNEILQLRTMESVDVWVIVDFFLAGGRKQKWLILSPSLVGGVCPKPITGSADPGGQK